MREIALPPLAELPHRGGLAELVFTNAEEAPSAVVFSRKVDGRWLDVTAEQFRREVVELARGLISAGIGQGDRIGIFSGNQYEWTLFDFGIWAAGAVSVPIYATSSAEQVQWILSDSGAVAVVVDNNEGAARAASAGADLTDLRHVWQIDAGGV